MEQSFNFPCWPFVPIVQFGSIMGLIAVAGVVFSILMLIDCLKRKPSQFHNPLTKNGEYDKLIWALAIVLTFSLYFIGSIVYFFVVKRAEPENE